MENIRTEQAELKVAGEATTMPAYLAIPEGTGPFAAVLVLEEIFGVNAHMREVTERVAKEGYVAIAPDYHFRSARGEELKYDAAGMQRGMTLIPKLSEKNVVADLQATLSFLRSRADVGGDRIGCIGFCIGGHVAYLAAALTDVRATASFYGGGIAAMGLGVAEPTVHHSAKIRGRILCLFGKNDSMIPEAQVNQIRAALDKGNVRHEIVVYDNAGHAFFCDNRERGSYEPKAANDAWTRVKKLFAEELRN